MSEHNYPGGFFFVPNDVFECGLSSRDIAVFCSLCSHINRRTGVAFPSRATIASDCGISKPDTVDKALKALESAGLIEKKHGYAPNGRYTSNVYRIIVSPKPG